MCLTYPPEKIPVPRATANRFVSAPISSTTLDKTDPILGQSPVVDGASSDVVVDIDTFNVTGTLYAMLHNDAGTPGLYEFPGSDVPVAAAGQVITPAFRVIGAQPEELPEAGGSPAAWPLVVVVLGALILLGGLGSTTIRDSR